MRPRLLLLAGLLLYVSVTAADQAVFAGGCFWCMEADFEKVPGVVDVISGFTGGTLKNPTYNGDHTGHYESVLVTYDARKVSYQQLLDYYWHHIDPFDPDGQFCDKGHAYQTVIFYATPMQRKLAEESKEQVQKQFPGQKVATKILPAGVFYPVKGDESYHQDFYKKSPIRYRIYRAACGRDRRVHDIWGNQATGH